MSKISELSDGGSLVSTDYLIAVRSGGNVKVRMDQINVDQVDLGDNEFIRLGNSQDLTLVHNASNSIINQAGIGDLLIQKAGSTKLTVNSTGIDVTGTVTTTGNVGIGTSTITSGFKLEVIGDARFGDVVGDDAVELGWSAGGSEGFIQAYDRGASAFRPLNINNSLKVDASGNVGIGTSSPNGNGILTLNTPTDNSPQIVFSENDTGKWLIGHRHDGDYFRFYDLANSAERMRIDASGNITQTGANSADFLIKAPTDNASLTLQAGSSDTGAEGAFVFFLQNTTYKWQIGMNTDNSFRWYNYATLSEAMQISPAGNVGIGITSPNANLAFGGNSAIAFNTSLGSTGTYGQIKSFNTLAPTNPATNIRFIRDVASVGNDGAICFDTVNTERARIDSSGNLLVGTTSQINTTKTSISASSTTNGLGIQNANDSNYLITAYNSSSVEVFRVAGTGDVTNTNNSYGSLSDERLKSNIVDASSQIDDIMAVQVRSYTLDSTGETHIGVVAQELESSGMSGLVSEDKDGMKSVKYSVLYMKALKALQEAMDRIETLEAKVAALES